MNKTLRLIAVLAVVMLASTQAYAQGGVTTSLSGTVVDGSGGVLPGADVVAKNVATTAESRTVTSENGTFTIPALNPGAYTVAVSLNGFKTAVLNDVVLNAATPASVRVTLEVGALAETVVVQAASEIVQTQSPAVSVTVDANRIINLPLSSRSALDFVVMLPGVQTPGSSRSSQINGLPRSAIAITWDGVNVQDNYLKSTDGFFAIINPRLDAIEEVTLTTAAQGADQTGQGAARINFVTRSGSNKFTGSGYHYFRHDALNANSWQRNRDGIAKANLLQNQPGARVGGPITIPGLFSGRDKAFFFVNYEEFRQPSEFTSTRTILHPRAQQGWFRYNTASGVQEVNVLDLARANGQLATLDPVVSKLLGDIRASTNGTGSVQPATNPSHESFTFPGAARSYNYYPTVRIDYNLTQNHRLTSTTNYQNFENFPDQTNSQEVRFPGFPSTAGQTSWRRSTSVSLRSALTTNLVNEARVAFVNYQVDFSAGVSASQFKGTPVADQNGYNIGLGFGLTGATSQANMSAREAPVREVGTTLSWIRGAHSLSLGGSLSNIHLKQWTQQLVPSIGFGVEAADPANGLFGVSNFPLASSTNLNDARALYALLTGRVNSIGGSAILSAAGEYNYNGLLLNTGSINEWGVFIQDQWRVRPGLTLNAGLRWEVQMPFTPGGDNYTTATYADVFGVSGLDSSGKPNLFKPGVMSGRATEFVKYAKGTRAYAIDYRNFAPTVGAAWTPSAEAGLLRRLFGSDGDSVLRAGYSKAFNRNGMNDYRGVFASNPGSSITATRNNQLGNLNLDGRGLPVLFRDASRLGPPTFPATPDYPLTVAKGTAQVTNSVNIFDPNMKTPYTHSWNVGLSRTLTRDMAVEVRYVGTRGRADWTTVNHNEVNIVENGFLEEFRRAQANLLANIAAGRGNTFAYTGIPGTSPLPIYLAHLVGRSDASNPAAYTGTSWSATNFTNPLARFNPNPIAFSNNNTGPASANANTGLFGTPERRANALRAGLPENFFLVNPGLLGGANIRMNLSESHYDSIQIELRRRLSNGLQMQASYAFGDTWANDFYSVRRPILESLDTGDPGTVRHAFKTDWVYEFPFGRGQRFGANAGAIVDRIIGGWVFAGTARIQSGQVVDLGNVRLVGITVDELKKLYGRYEYPQVFTNNAPMRIYRFPQDIIENSQRASSVSATSPTGYGPQGPPTGRYIAPANSPTCMETIVTNLTNTSHDAPGDCGTRVLEIRGPKVWFMDLSVVKRVPIRGRVNAEFRTEFLNAFNHPTLNGGSTGVVTPGGSRVIQLVSRVNW